MPTVSDKPEPEIPRALFSTTCKRCRGLRASVTKLTARPRFYPVPLRDLCVLCGKNPVPRNSASDPQHRKAESDAAICREFERLQREEKLSLNQPPSRSANPPVGFLAKNHPMRDTSAMASRDCCRAPASRPGTRPI
jgi:hypothetical protein